MNSYMQNNHTGLLYHSMHKNKFTNEAIKLLEKNGSTIFAIGPHKIFLICLPAQVKQKQK